MGTFKETLENITALREGFDKNHPAHHVMKSVSASLGKKKYNADGSASITTASKGNVSSTTFADHVLRSAGHTHNFSEKDLRNHVQNHEHPKHGKYHVHVSGSNAKGHKVSIMKGHRRGIKAGQYSSQL
jgi:hypothetical protein